MGTSRPPGRSRSGAADRIDRMIADPGDWRGGKLAEIRKVIHEIDPDRRRQDHADGHPG